MKPNEVGKLLSSAPSTIRLWSHEYGKFLSPSGAAGAGAYRDFTQDDLRVLYFVARQKEAGRHTDQIRATLAQMTPDDLQALPLPEDRTSAEMAVVPAAALDESRLALRLQNSMLQAQIDDLKAQLTEKDNKLDSARAEQRDDNERLLREIAEKEKQIGDLRADLRESEIQLKLYESGRLKPKRE